MNVRGGVKRAYDSSRRRQAAAERRTRMLRAAHRLFESQGYAATTMEAIAAAAEVSVETVYLAFHTKAELLARVIDVALAGDEEAVPLAERQAFLEVRDEPDQERQLELLARNVRGVLERAGPIQWAVLVAASQEPELAALVDRYQRMRLEVQTRFMGWVARHGPLRGGMSVEEGGRTYWTLASTEVHHMLRITLGLSADEYEAWLAGAFKAQLLGEQPQHPG